MTAILVVPTLWHHTPENRPSGGFFPASCEKRVSWVAKAGEMKNGPDCAGAVIQVNYTA